MTEETTTIETAEQLEPTAPSERAAMIAAEMREAVEALQGATEDNPIARLFHLGRLVGTLESHINLARGAGAPEADLEHLQGGLAEMLEYANKVSVECLSQV